MKSLVSWLCVLLTAVNVKAAAAAATTPTSVNATLDKLGTTSPEVEAAIDWVLDHGGEVNVVIRTLPSRGRKMYAARDFEPADLLMKIPLSVSFAMHPPKEEEVWPASATLLYAEMHNPDSKFQPYFSTLPTRDMVWSFYDLPESYLPLIQNTALEQSIAEMLAQEFNDTTKDIEGLRYTLSLLETRTFDSHEGAGLLMLPVMDMADHLHNCPNYYTYGECESNAGNETEQCIFFYAGDELEKGQEICIGYRAHLSQDMSLLQYGFLQGGSVSEMLSRIDRHDFNPDDPWHEPPFKRFTPITPADAQAEILRLQQLQADLQAGDADLKDKVKPHPRDTGGWYLDLMWTWRAQRQAAIAKELARLTEKLADLETACTAGGSGSRVCHQEPVEIVNAAGESLGEKSPEVEEAVKWLLQNDGEVNVVIRTLPSRGRKMYAAKDFEPDELLMKVPLSVSFATNIEEGEEVWSASAAQLYAEMHNPDSQFHLYFRTLPTREMVWSFYDLPESYLPLIQNTALEQSLSNLHRDALGSAAEDPEGLRYTLSLLETRTFENHEGRGLLMLPIMDMADHVHGCSNYYTYDDCDSDSDGDNKAQQCIYFYAGDFLEKGQEICIGYRVHLSQDMSLLQYGFLQDGVVSEMLSRIDRHDFNPEDPWMEPSYEDFTPLTPADAQAEILRLQQLQADLQAGDADLKDKVKPHPRDTGGWYLDLMWTWRAQRQAAVSKELARLTEVLADLQSTCTSDDGGSMMCLQEPSDM